MPEKPAPPDREAKKLAISIHNALLMALEADDLTDAQISRTKNSVTLSLTFRVEAYARARALLPPQIRDFLNE